MMVVWRITRKIYRNCFVYDSCAQWYAHTICVIIIVWSGTLSQSGAAWHFGLSLIWRNLFMLELSSLTTSLVIIPLPSNRCHPRNGDCLEGKRENCEVCSVNFCVQQCTVQCTHVWAVVCWLDLAYLWMYGVLQLICVRCSILGLFVLVCVCVLLLC